MIDAVKNEFFGKYADFSGRTNRKTFWFAILGVWIAMFVLSFVLGFIGGLLGDTATSITGILVIILELALVIPSLAIQVRRLHDIGKSGWWILLGLVPFGGIVLLVFYCLDTK